MRAALACAFVLLWAPTDGRACSCGHTQWTEDVFPPAGEREFPIDGHITILFRGAPRPLIERLGPEYRLKDASGAVVETESRVDGQVLSLVPKHLLRPGEEYTLESVRAVLQGGVVVSAVTRLYTRDPKPVGRRFERLVSFWTAHHQASVRNYGVQVSDTDAFFDLGTTSCGSFDGLRVSFDSDLDPAPEDIVGLEFAGLGTYSQVRRKNLSLVGASWWSIGLDPPWAWSLDVGGPCTLEPVVLPAFMFRVRVVITRVNGQKFVSPWSTVIRPEGPLLAIQGRSFSPVDASNLENWFAPPLVETATPSCSLESTRLVPLYRLRSLGWQRPLIRSSEPNIFGLAWNQRGVRCWFSFGADRTTCVPVPGFEEGVVGADLQGGRLVLASPKRLGVLDPKGKTVLLRVMPVDAFAVGQRSILVKSGDSTTLLGVPERTLRGYAHLIAFDGSRYWEMGPDWRLTWISEDGEVLGGRKVLEEELPTRPMTMVADASGASVASFGGEVRILRLTSDGTPVDLGVVDHDASPDSIALARGPMGDAYLNSDTARVVVVDEGRRVLPSFQLGRGMRTQAPSIASTPEGWVALYRADDILYAEYFGCR